LIEKGQFTHAVNLLGHSYPICGKVVKGFGRGVGLGYPTANIVVEKNKLIPKAGVYACYATVAGKTYKAVLNVGKNPTFNNKVLTIEVHILGLKKNLLGKKICLDVVKRIRNEKKFKTIEALKKAIFSDTQIAQEFLA